MTRWAVQDAGFDWPVALTSLSTLTLVLCQFTYDWVVFVIGRDVPAYFRQFLSLDIQIVCNTLRCDHSHTDRLLISVRTL